MDPELRPSDIYKGIKPLSFEEGGANRKTFREYCEEMVSICLEKHKHDKPKASSVSLFLCRVGLLSNLRVSHFCLWIGSRIRMWINDLSWPRSEKT